MMVKLYETRQSSGEVKLRIDPGLLVGEWRLEILRPQSKALGQESGETSAGLLRVLLGGCGANTWGHNLADRELCTHAGGRSLPRKVL